LLEYDGTTLTELLLGGGYTLAVGSTYRWEMFVESGAQHMVYTLAEYTTTGIIRRHFGEAQAAVAFKTTMLAPQAQISNGTGGIVADDFAISVANVYVNPEHTYI
jgi:hypothetical protein